MTEKRRHIRTAHAPTVVIRAGRKVYKVTPSAENSASPVTDVQAELVRADPAVDTKIAVSDPRRRVGREDLDGPATAEMLPLHWEQTLSRRQFDLAESRRILTGGRGTHMLFNSDREIHEKPNTYIFPPIDHFNFMSANKHVQPPLWPTEMDDRFERLAEENRGYAPHVFERELLDVPHLVNLVRRIVATDPSGRYFMHMDAERAQKFWTDPPRTSTWLSTAPIWSNAQNAAAKWAAGFAFTRMRRRIRWDPFPLRNCTLCGTEMTHAVDQAFGLGAPPRWCTSCVGPTLGLPTVAEAAAALRAYVAATGVIPFADEMIRCIPNDRPGPVRDVMAATRTTLQKRDTLRRIGLWPWGRALVRSGIIEGFVETKRGFQSEAADGHWCLSIFERQVDDFLTHRGIEHEHEPAWPAHPEFNPRGAKRADWRLPDGTLVEAAGMLDDPKYAAEIAEKRRLAATLGINLLVLTPETVLMLDEVFRAWLT